ncbi:hypothetical protein FRB91_005839 [Serendipita sp. 411]|nr:hypothetical protein FRB91_005839 [Serendipita sp. 411]
MKQQKTCSPTSERLLLFFPPFFDRSEELEVDLRFAVFLLTAYASQSGCAAEQQEKSQSVVPAIRQAQAAQVGKTEICWQLAVEAARAEATREESYGLPPEEVTIMSMMPIINATLLIHAIILTAISP